MSEPVIALVNRADPTDHTKRLIPNFVESVAAYFVLPIAVVAVVVLAVSGDTVEVDGLLVDVFEIEQLAIAGKIEPVGNKPDLY
jgi:hypothetical protein